MYRRRVSGLLPAERRRRILELVRERGAVRAAALVGTLDVSEVTIRRDLAALERRGLLDRTRGGAVLPAGVSTVVTRPERATQKRAIGRAAAALVRPGDTIFVNGGSTTLEVFRHLAVPATVITNNVLVALEPVNRDVELLLLGGHVRPDPAERTVVGPFATDALRRTFATRSFLGVGGLDGEHGVTTPVAAEAEIARSMVEQTREQVVVVADASKLGAVSDFGVCTLARVDALVTDAVGGERERGWLEEAGVDVVLAARS
jgi:DeoR/GlpR family transcriptional regulator of sugar metabolism